MPRLKRWKWDNWADERFTRFSLDRPDVLAIDTETSGTAYFDEAFCVTLSWRGRDDSLQSAYIELEQEGERLDPLGRQALVRDMLSSVSTWVFHNAKFDLQKLELAGLLPDGWQDNVHIEDTQVIFHLLDENSPKGLKPLAVSVLKYDDTIEVPYKTKGREGETRKVAREKHVLDQARKRLKLTKDDGYHLLPREVVVPYAMRDTDFTLLLYEKLKPKLIERGLEDVYAREIHLIDVFLRLEGNGFKLDLPTLDETTSKYGEREMELYLEIADLTGGINPDSPKQLLPVLREHGYDVDATDKATLKQLEGRLPQLVLDYRKTKKVHKTYLVALQREQRDGIVHPWFNIVGARTGRMSSGAAHE